MMLREKKDITPVLLKFGVALALSLGGILYSIFRTRRIKPSQSPPPSHRPSDSGNQVDSGGELAGPRSDHHALQKTPSSCNTASIALANHELPKVAIDDSIISLSTSSRSDGDKDGFLLPEFNKLVKEFDLVSMKANISPRKDVEALIPDADIPRGYKSTIELDDNEQEIKSLRNMVRILKERERTLEIQLLEYYGLKEQETAVMELQNRLKINSMEAKLFSLKIESMQADNRRLEAQVADYYKVVADLDSARAKIKLLKRKLRSEAEQNKEQILTLQKRVTKLQDQEHTAVASDLDTQLKLQKLKDLEEEAEELRNSNYSLWVEKSDLGQKLEYLQILATSVLEDEETERLKEESQQLRKHNEDLTKEIEQLQADRCADVEELVYLRWINACLRYELRNYQPEPGKTVARDLSKSLSPKSEEKAKQLILEYASKEGVGEKGISITEFDSDGWSSSQASYLTDSGEFDDSSVDNSSANKTIASSKRKIFGKLMKLLRGKHSHVHSRGSSLDRTACVEDVGTSYSDSHLCNSGVSTVSDTGIDGHNRKLRTSTSGPPRHSFNLQRSLYFQRWKSSKSEDSSDLEGGTRRNSDIGSSFVYKRIDSIAEGAAYLPRETQLHQESENIQKSELTKYAEVLKDSRGKLSKLWTRSASFS